MTRKPVNYTMGRYIDELDTEGRDRLIAAKDFAHGDKWFDGQCGCLCGTVMGVTDDVWWVRHDSMSRHEAMSLAVQLIGDIGEYSAGGWGLRGPATRFPYAIERFGKARVVRAIRLRAARANGTDVATVETIFETVVTEAVGV